jgi:hypothetical protein
MTDTHILAENFLRDQVAIMKKHGNEPRIDTTRYEETVRCAQRKFSSLSNACTRSKIDRSDIIKAR